MDLPTSTPPPAVPLWVELARLLRPGVDRGDPAWGWLRRVLSGRPPHPGVVVDWDAVALASRHAEVAVLAAEAHPELARRLDVAVRRQTLVDMNLELALDRVVRALSRAGVTRVALLKGAATAHTLYDRPLQRFRRDIDLLVAPEALPDVVVALLADGWREDVSVPDRARGMGAARAWPLVLDLPIGEIGCDLHQRIFDGGYAAVDPAGVLSRARPGLAPLPVPSSEDTLLVTAAHIAKGGFGEPLKAWVDLWRAATHTDLDVAATLARAREWGVRAATWGALGVVRRWFGAKLPPALLTGLAPPLWQRRTLQWLLAGEGAHPVRQDLSRHAASAILGPLALDDRAALGAWVRQRLVRRLPVAVGGER
ncbi:MAG: hypothetical protein CVU56_27175 [Deltaproteobacteria bacterium HGW-Deltaproteobacteria-14]|jgi:hypothetical protein|nr:MAG: hypothetical protein CVU56_27175 [Deltaproteobacteria bacterium HGW-Deltaproteobacteria-14]